MNTSNCEQTPSKRVGSNMFHMLPISVYVRMQNWGLNTYLYGPKDDLKHRLLWREVYSPEEEGKNMGFIHMFHLPHTSAFPSVANLRCSALNEHLKHTRINTT